MQLQPPPGHQLDHLLQGADAAGQHGEGVGLFEHDHLALVHRLHDHGLDVVVDHLAGLQEGGHDPQNLAAGAVRRLGAGAHQADPAAAIDQAQALARQGFAEPGSLGQVPRIGGVGRGAIDADGSKGGGTAGVIRLDHLCSGD